MGGWDSLWRRWRGGKSNVAMVTKNKQNIFIKVLVQCMPSLNKIGEHVFSGSLPRKVQTRLNLVFLCSWTKFQLHQNFDFSTIKKNNQLMCILAKSVYIICYYIQCVHMFHDKYFHTNVTVTNPPKFTIWHRNSSYLM